MCLNKINLFELVLIITIGIISICLSFPNCVAIQNALFIAFLINIMLFTINLGLITLADNKKWIIPALISNLILALIIIGSLILHLTTINAHTIVNHYTWFINQFLFVYILDLILVYVPTILIKKYILDDNYKLNNKDICKYIIISLIPATLVFLLIFPNIYIRP